MLSDSHQTALFDSLAQADPEISELVEKERRRQFTGLELIASENYTSVAVMQANGSILTNKYSEGMPGARYYGGNEVIDDIERLCQQRALHAFRLDPSEWGVNVQPYSGSTANFAAYTGLLRPHDRIMGLDLPSGGHLTHGFQTAKKKISASSIYFESMPYQVNPKSGYIDYEQLAANARLFHPNLIVCGASAYSREWDYQRLRQIADENGAMLMDDMAHISGLVASQAAADPFPWCDVVTTTTHKTLRGPRAGLIFFRKRRPDGTPTDYESRINFAVFPSCQGGPHNNTVAAIAVALKQMATPAFRDYAHAVVRNAVKLASALASLGHTLVTSGTDNHLVLWDLRPHKLTGSKMERLCELAKYNGCVLPCVCCYSISINKNSVPGDQSAMSPGGVRVGTAAITTRGFTEPDIERVAILLDRACRICIDLQEVEGGKLLKGFSAIAEQDPRVGELRRDVEQLATRFPMPGYPY